jgi:chromosome segregation protein
VISISRISMKNFKSFRRVSIPVRRGFTAIVGPNGSGKSNIVDAICFVLGRSSAKSLRAERFSDLIFNGGKKGKPASRAEVSLYLDNSGLELPLRTREVKISRSIDRSGESVYRLNDKRTTRAEILEVLSAAHIQPDGHNIVLQGDVTEVVEMNPVERRGIIDEIAGIAEYDDKKRKALRELEKVSENMAKVEAVMAEVKEQVEKLEREKEAALRHAFLKKEIRRSRGMVLTSKELEAKRGIAKLEKEIACREQATERARKHLDILQLKLEVKKKEIEKLNTKIILKEETENFEVFREIEKLKNELAYLEEKSSAARERLHSLRDEKKKAELGMDGISQEIKDYQSLNRKLEAEAEKLQKQIAGVKARLKEKYSCLASREKHTSRRKQLLETVASLEETQRKLHEAEKRKALLEERLSSTRKALETLGKEAEELKKELHEAQTALRETTKRRKILESAMDEDHHRKKDLVEESVEAKKKLERISILLPSKLETLARLEAETKVLEEIAKGSTSEAVREILKLRDTKGIKGVYGTIAELGEVKAKYAKALEAAAGGGKEFIVVDSDATAERCITHLKKKHLGRATFLPLNKLKPLPPTREAVKLAKHGHGFAVDLISFDKRFTKAFALVFRNTVVVEDIASARRAMGKARMATLDGDLVETTGVMSGGCFKTTGEFRKFNRSRERLKALKAEVRRLREERERLLREEAELGKELEELSSRELRNSRELEVLRERGRALEEKVAELRATLAGREASQRDLAAELKSLGRELSVLNRQVATLSAGMAKLQRKKELLEGELSLTSADEALEEIKSLEKEVSKLEKERAERQNQLSLNRSRIKEILKPKMMELREQLSRIALKSRNAEAELAAMEEKMRERRSRLGSLKSQANKVSGEIEELKTKRQRCREAISKIDKKLRDLRERLEGETRLRERARVEKARLETRLEEIQKALAGYSDLDLELEEPFATADMEREIAKMEAEMSSLEPINMRAVEDYDEVKAKYENLSSRIEVLLAEKEAILKLMEEIEHRKKAVFMEVFEGVAANFRSIFERLSPGGSAELLLDEENPLEGGLQIQAKPAGKNPQYIELMSGGEKTLTALSFIFAIQRFQPAPFYVLDEIDMFLDDDNVRRVSELIKECSRDAQFIVVSLRSSLMASADQLFGISSEDGVSKIIGVELAQHGA